MSAKTKNYVIIIVMSVFVLAISALSLLLPKQGYSGSERRELAQFPDVNTKVILSGQFMEEFEQYTLDQFPFRDGVRSLKAYFSQYVLGKKDNNNIYYVDGYLSKLEYPLNEEKVHRAAERFLYVYDKYFAGKNMNIYFSVIPDKNYFLAEKNGYISMDYDRLEEIMCNDMDFAEYIDITSLLTLDDYYRTDTHWKQESLIPVAEKIAEDMGYDLTAQYEECVLDNSFYGVYYGQSGLKVKPDIIRYFNNDMLDKCYVFDYESNKEISVYDMEKAYGEDPYEMYLSGPLSLITIDNPNSKTDKELIVFRDSFGSSIVPLLIENYSKITLIDIRYIQSDFLGNFIEFDNQDVLFLYSTLVLNNSETIK